MSKFGVVCGLLGRVRQPSEPSDPRGGSSYIDDVVLRDRDTTGNGTLDERSYFCQNWRHDVVALVTDTGKLLEQVRYAPYGEPFGLPAADTNSDGKWDATDQGAIMLTSGVGVGGPGYTALKDADLSGTIDSADITHANSITGGYQTLGRDVLTSTGVENRCGYAGYRNDRNLTLLYHVRHRVLHTELGRWTKRDPLGYVDGVNLYAYAAGNPIAYLDAHGLCCQRLNSPQWGNGWSDGGSNCDDRVCAAVTQRISRVAENILDWINQDCPDCYPVQIACWDHTKGTAPNGWDADCAVNGRTMFVSPPGARGNAQGSCPIIVICCKQLTMRDLGRLKKILIEELTHYYDACTGNLTNNATCADCICAELRGGWAQGIGWQQNLRDACHNCHKNNADCLRQPNEEGCKRDLRRMGEQAARQYCQQNFAPNEPWKPLPPPVVPDVLLPGQPGNTHPGQSDPHIASFGSV